MTFIVTSKIKTQSVEEKKIKTCQCHIRSSLLGIQRTKCFARSSQGPQTYSISQPSARFDWHFVVLLHFISKRGSCSLSISLSPNTGQFTSGEGGKQSDGKSMKVIKYKSVFSLGWFGFAAQKLPLTPRQNCLFMLSSFRPSILKVSFKVKPSAQMHHLLTCFHGCNFHL